MIEPDQLTDPERKIWAYVLLQAQSDLGARDSIARSARLWFCSRDDAIGSFTWICHHLSLEPNAVRQRVLKDPPKRLAEAIAYSAEVANRAA